MSKINKDAKRRLDLPAIDREYTLYELAIITRAGTAKSLKLNDKGHLGLGADADVAIYDFDPQKSYPERDYIELRKSLKKTSWTIKGGSIVSENGEIKNSDYGETYWVKSIVPDDVKNSMLANIESKFNDYYTIELGNYMIREDYLINPQTISVNSEVST
jgi:formylmethanofuran dehydrogenase subunit A